MINIILSFSSNSKKKKIIRYLSISSVSINCGERKGRIVLIVGCIVIFAGFKIFISPFLSLTLSSLYPGDGTPTSFNSEAYFLVPNTVLTVVNVYSMPYHLLVASLLFVGFNIIIFPSLSLTLFSLHAGDGTPSSFDLEADYSVLNTALTVMNVYSVSYCSLVVFFLFVGLKIVISLSSSLILSSLQSGDGTPLSFNSEANYLAPNKC